MFVSWNLAVLTGPAAVVMDRPRPRASEELKESVRPLVVHLLDGTEVRGHIEYYDTNMIKITRPEGPHFFVRKSDIRYIVEAE